MVVLVLVPASWEDAGAGEPSSTDVRTRAAAPSCGPAVLRKPDGTEWRCSFADEFDGRRLSDARWTRMTTAATSWTGGPECYLDSGPNVRLRDGKLLLTVRQEAQSFLCDRVLLDSMSEYTGGSISTYGRFSQIYGRYEFRAAFPRARTTGLHSALWLYPVKQAYAGLVPKSGEIDVAEFYTRYPGRVIPFLHYTGDFVDQNRTNNYCFVRKPWRFHTYLLVWTPASIRIAYDGKTCLKNSRWTPLLLQRPAPFDHPYAINLTQALGIGHNPFSPSRTELPATMRVDYVRVWK
ncbi:MAG TPA: glycoside hydrolase family 16 protein [Nocardioidaceae bacterium]|nr:glycoside hydrolase family 16 protein [Nocardioidaceae bacterium]